MLRADELDAFFFQTARELGVLGQEAVARMDGLGAGLLAGSDDLVHDQVGLFRGSRADTDGFVGEIDVQRVLVGFGIDGDGLDAHLAGGLDDAAGDFSPVRDQDLVKHGALPPGRNRLSTLCVQGNLAALLRRCAAGRRGLRSEF